MTNVVDSVHMMEPVCRSPWSSAAPSHANLRLSEQIADLSSESVLSAAAASSSCGEVQWLLSALAYGSVKMTCSVSAHMSSFCPNACLALRSASHPIARAEDPNRVVARYSPTCAASLGYTVPAMIPPRRIMCGGSR